MNLVLTDAGRGAIADGQNQGTAAVSIVEMAIGDGRAPVGADDSDRAALRNERLRETVGGTTPVDDRFVAFAEFTDNAVWEVTEAGLFAQVGANPKFLFAYHAVHPGDDAIAAITANTSVALAAVVEVVSSAADLDVALSAMVQLLAPNPSLLLDLHAYGSTGSPHTLNAPAEARRWLVAVFGGGGVGETNLNGSSGGSASLVGTGANVSATGGDGGGGGSLPTEPRNGHDHRHGRDRHDGEGGRRCRLARRTRQGGRRERRPCSSPCDARPQRRIHHHGRRRRHSPDGTAAPGDPGVLVFAFRPSA